MTRGEKIENNCESKRYGLFLLTERTEKERREREKRKKWTRWTRKIILQAYTRNY